MRRRTPAIVLIALMWASGWTFSPAAAKRSGNRLELQPREFRLLEYFIPCRPSYRTSGRSVGSIIRTPNQCDRVLLRSGQIANFFRRRCDTVLGGLQILRH